MHIQITNARLGATTVVTLTLLWLSACGPDSSNPSEEADAARSITGLTAADWVAESPVTGEPEANEVAELDWNDLIPPDWRPEKLLEDLSVDGESLDDIPDEDPRAEAVMNKLMALWKQAPVVEALDGQRVKLPGFVVPLAFDLSDMTEFLLVPYYGACIHVPPPPANQTVHVVLPQGKSYRGGVFDTVWVTGILRIERFSSEMAEAGYRFEALEIAPYSF